MADRAGSRPDFTIVLTGYDRAQVDAYLERLRQIPRPPGPPPSFDKALRGYEVEQVDAHIRQLLSGEATGPAASEALAAPGFTVVLRGYDRREVERFVADAQRRIADLEATIAGLTARLEQVEPG